MKVVTLAKLQEYHAKLKTALSNKVDKVTGKGLSTEDYTSAEKTKLSGIATNANNYTHPSTSGSKHIPSGGSSGQFLKWSADGTAVWANDNNTDTKVTQTNSTGNADYRLILSQNANDTTETNTTLKSGKFVANPSTGEMFVQGFRRIDITGQTLDLNTLDGSTGYPAIAYYQCKSNGGSANITNIPVTGNPFILTVEVVRYVATSDYITRQTFTSTNARDYDYVRWNTSGTWSAWQQRKYSDTTYTHPTTSGNKHIPSGGSSGQILKYSADGTATWANEYSYSHPNSGVTASTKGATANVTGSNGATIKVPKITVNAQGHVTALDEYTFTAQNTTYSASSTTPKGAGTASAGSETAYARGDHVHPAQTSVTGNAGTATTLATARTLTIGSTGKTFNGSANVSWSLAEIGAVGNIKVSSGANINAVGTPSVTVSTSGNETILTFNYLKGAKGDAGAKPVKGTDYFTDADKQSIIDAVIAEIPNALANAEDQSF